jgi:serine/threonine-protein kinase
VGRFDDFAAELAKSMKTNTAPAYQQLADEIPKAFKRGGHTEVLRVWAKTWEPMAARDLAQASSMAMIYGRMGEKETALRWLEQAFRDRTRSMAYIKVEPQFDSLRSDPRFQDIVKKMGLPP